MGVVCIDAAFGQIIHLDNLEPAIIDSKDIRKNPNEFYFLKDPENKFDFEDLNKTSNEDWVPSVPDDWFSENKVWTYTAFQFDSHGDHSWLLQFQNPFVRQLEIYIEVDGVLQNHYITGAELNFDTRPIFNREFIFPVEIKKDSLVRVFVGVRDARTRWLPISMISQKQFYETEQNTQAMLMLLYGALAMMIFYNIILYFSVRDISYLWYSLSVAAMLIVQISASQYTFQYILGNFPAINAVLTALFLWLFHIFSALFCIHVLELKKLSIVAYRYFLVLVTMNFVLIILTSVTSSELVNDFGYCLGILNYVSYCSIGIYAWFRGVGYASYFTIGWAFLCVVRIQVNWNVLTSNYNTGITSWVLLGLLWEALLLSIAMAVRIREMQKEEILEKEEFFARISHELRTPINGILGGLELLFPKNQADRGKDVVKCLFQSTYQLYNIVQDILTFSKYSEQKVELKVEHMSLRSFLSDLQSDFSQKLKNTGILYSFSVAKTLPDSVSFDRGRLHTVLSKLLDNSCKYVESGYIVLYITEFERQDGRMLVRFSIRDTGAGIHEKELSSIFEEFKQSGSYYTRTHQGLGLGLSTVVECLRRMDSKIHVKSTVGKGSNFYFDLWMDYEEVVEQRTETNRLKNMRVLLVEDNPVNQLVTQKMLEKEGSVVDIADNGLKGINKVKESNYDLVLMDCAMPVVSGFEATQEIRKMGYASLPIIAVTANAMDGDREKCLVAGMDDYLAKPIDRNSLVVCIVDVMNRKIQQAS